MEIRIVLLLYKVGDNKVSLYEPTIICSKVKKVIKDTLKGIDGLTYKGISYLDGWLSLTVTVDGQVDVSNKRLVSQLESQITTVIETVYGDGSKDIPVVTNLSISDDEKLGFSCESFKFIY